MYHLYNDIWYKKSLWNPRKSVKKNSTMQLRMDLEGKHISLESRRKELVYLTILLTAALVSHLGRPKPLVKVWKKLTFISGQNHL